MRLSHQWCSEFFNSKESPFSLPDHLPELLTSRGIEVEEIEDQSRGLEKVVVAQVIQKAQHPDADRLSVCKVKFSDEGVLDIVCGAQNFKAGDKVALAQIGARLPNGMLIKEGKIRGALSQGMLCSEAELGFAEPHQFDGIILLPESAKVGQNIAEFYQKTDRVYTLKLTANRSDCLSHFGLAREIGAALEKKPHLSPLEHEVISQMEWKPGSQKHFKKEGVLQFATALIKNVKVGPSPQWLVKKLEAMGSRSINNVVDATNLILWELGHPVHAYDADRLKNSVGARFAESGERLQLLDDSIIELTNHDLVIVDQVLNDVSQSGTRPIGLAGVMGGADTQVTDQTTHLLLECAQFTPHFVRKSKQYHQKLTEAAYRFERGIDGESVRFDLERLADLVLKVAGGQLVEKTYVDLRDQAAGTQKWIPMSTEWLNRFLGTSLEAPLIKKILQNLDCEVIENSKNPSMISWKVNPPSYRLDLNLPEDLAEEIARTVGYDVIPSTVPALSSQPSSLSNLLEALSVLWADQVKDAFVQNGFNEVLNYAFTNQDQLHKLGFHSPVIRLMNPLSQDHEVLVPSLIPGLLKNAHDNFRKHFGSEACQLKLFEVRPVFSKKAEATLSESETGISESLKIAFLLSGSRIQQGLKQDLVEYDFFDLKAVIEKLFDEIEVRGVRIIPLQQSRSQLEVKGCFHPGQACEVLVGNQSAGYFGALHPNLAKQFKFKQKIFICELDGAVLRQLSRKAQQARKFKEWPEFPGMERDFSLIVKSDVSSEQLIKTVLKAGQPLAKKAKIFDIYRGSSIPQGMTSVAFKVIFLDESRSLQESETEAASQQILQALQKEFDAQLRM